MSSRCDGIPHLVPEQGTATPLERITFDDREINEGWLQELMFENPEILPVNDIDPGFGPLIPIGREIGTDVGPIDNLYISPSGSLTIVEAKLWRNPQARREVVGQIIDYAKEVSRWDYEDLDAATERACGKRLWDLVGEHSDPLLNEPKFIDTVTRNLNVGRFLLLIVGDGIREAMERMAEFLQDTPQLRFSLALIELQAYRLPETDQLLVTPVVVSRTKEISRAIVRVSGDAGAKVDVSLDITDASSGPASSPPRSLTHTDFFQGLEESGASAEAIRIAHRIHDEFDADDRFLIDWKSASFSLKLRDPVESRIRYTMLAVERAGTAYIGWLGSQLKRAGLSSSPAHEYVKMTGQLVDRNVHKNDPDSWETSVSLDVLSGVYDEFKGHIEELARQIYSERQEAG